MIHQEASITKKKDLSDAIVNFFKEESRYLSARERLTVPEYVDRISNTLLNDHGIQIDTVYGLAFMIDLSGNCLFPEEVDYTILDKSSAVYFGLVWS